MVMTPHKPAPCPTCGTDARQLLPGVFDCLACRRIVFANGRKAELRQRVATRKAAVLRKKRRRCQDFRVNHEAMAFPGQFSPVFRIRKETLIDSLDFYLGPEVFDQTGLCARCHQDDNKPDSKTARRPVGTMTRDACAGCVVSYLDRKEEPAQHLRAELADARARVVFLEGVITVCEEWSTKRRAVELLDEAHGHLVALAKKLKRFYPTFAMAEAVAL